MKEVAHLILTTRRGAIIVQHRDDRPDIMQPNKFSIFGGMVEAGETPLEAAVREAAEETNLHLRPEDFHPFGKYELTQAEHGTEYVAHCFLVRDIDPDYLEIYEGQGTRIIAGLSDLGAIVTTPILQIVAAHYFPTHKPTTPKERTSV